MFRRGSPRYPKLMKGAVKVTRAFLLATIAVVVFAGCGRSSEGDHNSTLGKLGFEKASWGAPKSQLDSSYPLKQDESFVANGFHLGGEPIMVHAKSDGCELYEARKPNSEAETASFTFCKNRLVSVYAQYGKIGSETKLAGVYELLLNRIKNSIGSPAAETDVNESGGNGGLRQTGKRAVWVTQDSVVILNGVATSVAIGGRDVSQGATTIHCYSKADLPAEALKQTDVR